MDNQHRKIAGYRELTQDDIDLMNRVKAVGAELLALQAALAGRLSTDLEVKQAAAKASKLAPEHESSPECVELRRFLAAEPLRWAAIAKTDIQTGVMPWCAPSLSPRAAEVAVYITLPELAERPGAEELSQAATPQQYRAVQTELLDALLRGLPVDQWTPEEIEVGNAAVEVIDSAVSDARSFIDGFLQQRGYLPLQQRFGIVVGWHRAITRYLLHKDRLGEGAEKDPIVRDYRDALKFLQLTAEGKFSLGQDDPVANSTSGAPQVVTPGRTFSLDQLKDF